MRIKIMIVFIACLFLSYSKPNYPTIIVYLNITDKQTKKAIIGARCTLDITYETNKCLPYAVEPFPEYSDIRTFITRDSFNTYALRNPPKKYVFEVSHIDYNTVIKRDSFNKCKFGLTFDIELETKQ